MKKILLLSLIGLFISCGNQNCETPSNGFIDGTGQSVTLGSEATVDVFKSIDKAWVERDYETLKSLISNVQPFLLTHLFPIAAPRAISK